jgi:low affinity Fe/Cu permease
MHDKFRRFAQAASEAVGSAGAFLSAVVVVAIWTAFGPAMHYSDAWQLVINTATTIATFLMVFVIQYTQNRDTRVIQLKLDELIRALRAARTELVNLESLSDEDLERLRGEFEQLSRKRAQPEIDTHRRSRGFEAHDDAVAAHKQLARHHAPSVPHRRAESEK